MFLRSFVLALSLGFTFAATAAPAPKAGDLAPDFSLKGSDGKTYKLSELKGQTVVLEWFNPECPFVKKFYKKSTAMVDLQKEAVHPHAGTPPVIWLTIDSSAKGKQGHLTEKEAAKVRQEFNMQNTALLVDPGSKIAKLYHAQTTPSFYIIDNTGKIAYEGAVDDQPSADPETLKGAHNYVLEALGSLANNRSVPKSSTTPYGCSVKY